jgi:hypothetical protein
MSPGHRASTPPRRAAVDLGARVDIRDGQCSFGPRLEHALQSLIVREGFPPVAKAGRVTLAGAANDGLPHLGEGRGLRIDGDPERRLRRSACPAARWNGLRLTGLRRSTGWAFAASSLEFSDSPARLRATLRRMGIAILLPPAIRDIPTDECAASIAIEARPHGSALTCSSGS